MNPWTLWWTATGLALMSILPRPAQAQDEPASGQGLRRIELQAGQDRLSADYANWQDASVRGDYRLGDHLWSGELLHADRFGERGSFAGLQDRVHIAPRWDVSLHYGVGEGARWLPRDRVDGFLHHSWGQHDNWVTHLGAGYYRAMDEHRDRWASVGLSAYLEPYVQGPWVVQGEMRWTQSNPGSVGTRQQFVAVSWGRQGATVLTARHGWGREGWQSLGDAVGIVDFASRQDTLTLQQWISPEWGIKLTADHYRNDTYRRTGLSLAVFRQWP